jgi:hypothetical protein
MKKGERKQNQFAENSGLIPLTSNPGVGAFDRDFLRVLVPCQGRHVGLCGNVCCPFLSDSFGERWLRCLSPVLPWCVGSSGTGELSEVDSPKDCFVSSHWLLLITGQFAILLYDHSLLRFSKVVKYVSDCTRQQLCCFWLWQVSPFPNKVGQLSLELPTQFPKLR